MRGQEYTAVASQARSSICAWASLILLTRARTQGRCANRAACGTRYVASKEKARSSIAAWAGLVVHL